MRYKDSPLQKSACLPMSLWFCLSQFHLSLCVCLCFYLSFSVTHTHTHISSPICFILPHLSECSLQMRLKTLASPTLSPEGQEMGKLRLTPPWPSVQKFILATGFFRFDEPRCLLCQGELSFCGRHCKQHQRKRIKSLCV